MIKKIRFTCFYGFYATSHNDVNLCIRDSKWRNTCPRDSIRIDAIGTKLFKFHSKDFQDMDDMAGWKNLIHAHLGCTLKHRVREIKSNIEFVDLGLKTAYLLDFGVSSLQPLVNLITDLKNHNYIQCHLKALEIGMDYVVVNSEEFLNRHSELDKLVKFVDISSNIKTPKILDMNDALNNVKALCFSLVSENAVSKTETDVNLSSVFGVLIGYPVVYWFDSDSLKSMGNSQVVQHVEVVGRRSDRQTDVVYSFSYPDCLIMLEKHINNWFENWKEMGKWKKLFETILLKCERKTLVSLVL
ncbi:UPF0739 protein C1orf74 homolog isoform X2 [Ostrea edulis]|uniref:UPF0739 protein C1orf74 homolog isoform X2 n=1 Tax=Ostrea edulis TaxID=37623 RepID=UPI0024AF6C83|nr:UPF0739 protein C1orf74 homolog isoform X2 [Ostrea edulis]